MRGEMRRGDDSSLLSSIDAHASGGGSGGEPGRVGVIAKRMRGESGRDDDSSPLSSAVGVSGGGGGSTGDPGRDGTGKGGSRGCEIDAAVLKR